MISAAPPTGYLPASSAPPAYGSPTVRAGAVPHSPAGTRNAACVPRKSAGSPTVPAYPLPPAPATAAIDRSPPGSPPPTDTFARYSVCLASTSTPGFGRRRRLARLVVGLASSCDFLQGTFEKIHLQRFFRQGLFQQPVFPL